MADLLGAPLQLQQVFHLSPFFLDEVTASVATVIPGDGVGVGDEGSVLARRTQIAFLLAVQGAWMPAQFLCDLRNRVALG